MKNKIIPLVLILFFIGGCASIPVDENSPRADKVKSFAAPDKGKSGIYIFRDSILGTAILNKVWVDGKCIGDNAVKTYLHTQVEGNKIHKFTSEGEFDNKSLEIETKSDKNHFLRHSLLIGLFKPSSKLESVSEDEAKPIIKELKLAKSRNCSDL